MNQTDEAAQADQAAVTSLLQRLHQLQGFTQPTEHEALWVLAAGVPPTRAIVELGTYKAKGTCFLACGADPAHGGRGAHVWTVDPWDLPGFRTTTGKGRPPAHPLDYTDPSIPRTAHTQVQSVGVADRVSFIQGFSEDVGHTWRNHTHQRVGMLLIDGDHREGAARRDFAAWEPHLARGAIVAWDDHRQNFPGVINVVAKLGDKGLLSEPEMHGNLAVTIFKPDTLNTTRDTQDVGVEG